MNTSTPTAAGLSHVTKRFGNVTALDDVSLDIPRGSIMGLLGANGAGKTTLLHTLIGLILPDAGSCQTLGVPASELPADVLARIGFVHQEADLVDWMTTRQMLDYVRAYYPTWNDDLVAKLANRFELPNKKHVGALSPGQRQRLAILMAVGFEPELLILDEPAAGLDPIARADFLDMLLDIIQDPNRTILISSHILSDVEKIIDRTVIMENGHIRWQGPLDTLQESTCRLRITATEATLPASLPFSEVVCETGDEHQRILVLPPPPQSDIDQIERSTRCTVEKGTLTLEELYRVVLGRWPRSGANGKNGESHDHEN